MDPRNVGLVTTPVMTDLNLQCDNCKSVFLTLKNEGKPFSLFDIVRAALRHPCEN